MGKTRSVALPLDDRKPTLIETEAPALLGLDAEHPDCEEDAKQMAMMIRPRRLLAPPPATCRVVAAAVLALIVAATIAIAATAVRAEPAPAFEIDTAATASVPMAASPPVAAALRDDVSIFLAVHEKAIVAELAWFLARPNFASGRVDMAANAEALVGMMQRRGLTTLRLSVGRDAPPTIYGELPAGGARRTVLIYAHYDGWPVVQEPWHGDPWHLVLRDRPSPTAPAVELDEAPAPLPVNWRLFARSVSDAKGPIVALLAALDALHEAGVPPSVNLKLLFDGEAEVGSPHLPDLLDRHRALLTADAWVIAGGPAPASGQLQVVLGPHATPDLPAVRALVQATAAGLGRQVLAVPHRRDDNLAHHHLNELLGDRLQVPVIELPIVSSDDNRHAADESLPLQNLWDGIQIFAALLAHRDSSK